MAGSQLSCSEDTRVPQVFIPLWETVGSSKNTRGLHSSLGDSHRGQWFLNSWMLSPARKATICMKRQTHTQLDRNRSKFIPGDPAHGRSTVTVKPHDFQPKNHTLQLQLSSVSVYLSNILSQR